MLNVLYIGDPLAEECTAERNRYLDKCLDKCSAFCLLPQEKSFIKDYILLIAYYIDFVLIEEERDVVSFAQLLTYSKVINHESQLLKLIDDTINNGKLTDKQNGKLLRCYQNIGFKAQYFPENVLLTLQVIQFLTATDPESSKAVTNLINLAILKFNMEEDAAALSELCSKAADEQYFSFVYPEFSFHYEELLKKEVSESDTDELIHYAYELFERLPENVKEKIKKYKFEIKISNILLASNKDYRKLGSTHLCRRQIRVWFVKDKTAIDLSFYHEIGHVVDYVFGGSQLLTGHNPAWNIIYTEEKECFFMENTKKNPEMEEFYEYSIKNEMEYFATAFSEYIQSPEYLKAIAPNTFYYLETLLSFEK